LGESFITLSVRELPHLAQRELQILEWLVASSHGDDRLQVSGCLVEARLAPDKQAGTAIGPRAAAVARSDSWDAPAERKQVQTRAAHALGGLSQAIKCRYDTPRYGKFATAKISRRFP
jgi:hypothetical protein